MASFACQCGALQGDIEEEGVHSHVVCYCHDCQRFPESLGAEYVLDAQGGTEIVQVAHSRLRITQGREHLAMLRLSERGMLRWYAACCNSPIGNTMPGPKIGFIGLIAPIIQTDDLNAEFGPITSVVNVNSAKGELKPKGYGLLTGIRRILLIMLDARLGGKYRQSLFFDQKGKPVVVARILDSDDDNN